MIAKFVLLFCLALSAAAADRTPPQRFSRSVAGTGPDQALLAVKLDSAVYAASAADFRDLRLVDQDGVETPYLLQKIAEQKAVTRRMPSAGKIIGLNRTGENGIELIAALDKTAANADGLTIVTTQRDYEYIVQIFGSADGKTWQALADNARIFDYSRYARIGNNAIELPANAYRQFKIVVAQASQTHSSGLTELTRTLQNGTEQQRSESVALRSEPLHIDRIEFWQTVTDTVADAAQRFDYPVAFKIVQDAELKASLIEIDSKRQPLTGFSVQSYTPNFNRRAEVQVSDSQGLESRTRTLGQADLQALHFQGFDRDQTEIEFAEQRREHYRIVVYNEDNPPLHINTVTGIGPGYRLLFLAQAGRSYQLLYGADKAEAPRYDVAPIQELLRRGYRSSDAELGEEVALAQPEPEFDWAEQVNSRWFLGLAIAAVALVLAWSLFKIGKRIGDFD
ncbi:hypothetical protein A1507_21045 [Methylomonas koyamae]|uniref:DUF3999 domain-containing protein n=1 Tax=Methylomonas koyamae TaxID=702114 RepID=A0A177N1C0_9GAMM|nr:DUF3999 family protein [Methylomonas koyamae]OAI11010.1 hypothetical protein A1507_21045 [Methylomonas koyamae]